MAIAEPYSFDDGDITPWTTFAHSGGGWVEAVDPALTALNGSQGNRIPFDGAGNSTAGSDGYYITHDPFSTRDAAHPSLRFVSPIFELDASSTISFTLLGGTGTASSPGADIASLPVDSVGTGFQGVALRRLSDDAYLISARRSANSQGDNWESFTWTYADFGDAIADDPPGISYYTLEFVDTRHGGWGWAAFDEVSLPVPAIDSDADGLPDEWEQQIIDAAAVEVPPVIMTLTDVKGPNDAPEISDYDNDGALDADEHSNLTDPVDPDSDDDGLLDGVEDDGGSWGHAGATGTDPLDPDTDDDGLLDGVENPDLPYDAQHPATQPGSNPHLHDTDADSYLDMDEVILGSDPTDAGSIPTMTGDLTLIGCDDFAYPDGPVADRMGGEGFDFDNDLISNAFIGHTLSPAAWTGSANSRIVSNTLETVGSTTFRRHEAPVEAIGAVATGPGYDTSVIYFRVDIDVEAGTDVYWSGISSFSFANEQVFFGKNTAATEWMFRIYNAPEVGNYSTGISVDDRPHTLVGKIDYANDEIKMWMDPDLSGDEASAPADATAAYTGEDPSTATRLGSGGSRVVTWDNLVIARAWSALDKLPVDDSGLRIVAADFDNLTRTFSFTWGSSLDATYTVSESSDLSLGTWDVIDDTVLSEGDTTTTFFMPGLPENQRIRMYHVHENP